MCTISLSLAEPGEAMPGPYSSLMVFRRRASRSGAGRAVRGRKTQDNADTRSLFRYVFDVVEQRSTMALFTARADGRSATPAPLDFCKARLWQVTDASIDLRDPNMN